MMSLMKFAIFGNTYQPKKSLHALRLFELLKKQGAEICMCREFYQFLTRGGRHGADLPGPPRDGEA